MAIQLPHLPRALLIGIVVAIAVIAAVAAFFLLQPGVAALSVTVSSAGQPVAGAMVSVESSKFSASETTDETGVASFKDIPKGPVTITVEKGGFEKRVQRFTAGSRPTVNLEIRPQTVTISLTVADQDTGQGLSGATVSYTAGTKQGQLDTDSSGNVKIETQALTDVSITAVKEDYDPRSTALTNVTNETGAQRLALSRSASFVERLTNVKGRLLVSVTDDQGRPLPGTVRVYDANNRGDLLSTQSTGTAGKVSITTLKVNTLVYVAVDAPGFISQTTNDFAIEETVSKTVSLSAAIQENVTVLSVSTLDESRASIPASVFILSGNGDVLAQNQSQGRIEYTLERGTNIALVAYARGKLPFRAPSVSLDKARISLEALLNTSTPNNSFTLQLSAKDFAELKPVGNASAIVYSDGLMLIPDAKTDKNGRASIADVPIGSGAEVRVTKNSLRGIGPVNESNVNLTVLLYPPTAQITFKAVDAKTGATLPAANFTVLKGTDRLAASSCITSTGSCARPVFVGIPLSLRASSPGYVNRLQQLMIDEEQPQTVKVLMFSQNPNMIQDVKITTLNDLPVGNRLNTGQLYKAKFTVRAFSNASRTGLFVQAGDRLGNPFNNDSIVLLRRSADPYLGDVLPEVVTAAASLSSTSCAPLSAANAFGGLKWINIEGLTDNTSGIDIDFNLEFAAIGSNFSSSLFYRAYQVVSGDYVREPFDTVLQSAYETTGRTWCHAKLTNTTRWFVNARPSFACGVDGCVTFTLAQNGTLSRPYQLDLAGEPATATYVVDRFNPHSALALSWKTGDKDKIILYAADRCNSAECDPAGIGNVDPSSDTWSYQAVDSDFVENEMTGYVQLAPQADGPTIQTLKYGTTILGTPVRSGLSPTAGLVNYQIAVEPTSNPNPPFYRLEMRHGNNVAFNYDANASKLDPSEEGNTTSDAILIVDPLMPVDAVRISLNNSALSTPCTWLAQFIGPKSTCFKFTQNVTTKTAVLSYDGTSQACRTMDPNEVNNETVILRMSCAGAGTKDVSVKVVKAQIQRKAVALFNYRKDDHAICDGRIYSFNPNIYVLVNNQQYNPLTSTIRLRVGARTIPNVLSGSGITSFVSNSNPTILAGNTGTTTITSVLGTENDVSTDYSTISAETTFKRGATSSPITEAFPTAAQFNYVWPDAIDGVFENRVTLSSPPDGSEMPARNAVTLPAANYLDKNTAASGDAGLNAPFFYVPTHSARVYAGTEISDVLGTSGRCYQESGINGSAPIYPTDSRINLNAARGGSDVPAIIAGGDHIVFSNGVILRYDSWEDRAARLGQCNAVHYSIFDSNLVGSSHHIDDPDSGVGFSCDEPEIDSDHNSITTGGLHVHIVRPSSDFFGISQVQIPQGTQLWNADPAIPILVDTLGGVVKVGLIVYQNPRNPIDFEGAGVDVSDYIKGVYRTAASALTSNDKTAFNITGNEVPSDAVFLPPATLLYPLRQYEFYTITTSTNFIPLYLPHIPPYGTQFSVFGFVNAPDTLAYIPKLVYTDVCHQKCVFQVRPA